MLMPRKGANRRAIDKTIAALKASGRLEDADSALVAALQSLADAVDVDTGNAALWREYRAYEQRLRQTGEGTASGLDAALAALSTPMGDSKKS